MPDLETKEHKSINDETWNHTMLIQVLPNSSNLEHTQHHTCLFFLIRKCGCQRQPEGVLPPKAQQAVLLGLLFENVNANMQVHKNKRHLASAFTTHPLVAYALQVYQRLPFSSTEIQDANYRFPIL